MKPEEKEDYSAVVDELLKHRCSCAGEQNKVLLEAVSACPDCFSFFSTVTAEVPPEKLEQVVRRIVEVLRELGLEPKGLKNAARSLQLKRRLEEAEREGKPVTE